MSYLLDSNAFIQSHNIFYQMSFCPGFWEWIDREYQAGRVMSVYPVYEELAEHNRANRDELENWAYDRRDDFFLKVEDEEIQQNFAEVARYVQSQGHLNIKLVEEFLDGADPWLVAKAMTDGSTIVTQEKYVPPESTKPKIPNVAEYFGVSYCDVFEALNATGANLVLGR